MDPLGFQQRLQDLADNITNNQALLKDFEEALLYETNPKIIARYRRDIELLRESVARYRQEYNQLQRDFSKLQQEMKRSQSQTQEVGNYWQHMQTRLDVLGRCQEETYQNLHQMRQEWFKEKDKPEVPDPPEPPEPPEPLANYTHLSDLLAAEKWKEADIETTRVLLELTHRQTNGWLRVKDIDVLPCPDLKQIDKLWIEYSNGQFGLSLQQQIWSQVGGQLGKFDNNIFYKFGDRVGWRKNNEWLKNEELEFTSDAPEGHLPSLFFTNPNNPGGWFGLRKDSFNHFLPRLSACLSK